MNHVSHSYEDLIDGLRVIVQRRGYKIQQGDVIVVERAIDALMRRAGPGDGEKPPSVDLEILRMALGNTAACLGDALATFNRVVGQEVFKNAAAVCKAEYDPKTEKCRGECDCGIGQACKAYLAYIAKKLPSPAHTEP